MLRNWVLFSPPDKPGLWYFATTLNPTRSFVRKNIALLAGESFPFPGLCPTGNCAFQDLFIDLTGDRLPDAISYNASLGGNPWIARNTGNGFLDRVEIHGASAVGGPSGSFPPLKWDAQGILLADLNGDGKQDVILTSGDTGNKGIAAMLAGDVDFQVPFYLRDTSGAILPLPDDPGLAVFADVNGDGLPDLLEVVKGELHVYRHLGKRADVITTITEGTNEIHRVSWAPISDPNVHQTVRTCAFPTVCVKNGLWVVSELVSDSEGTGTRHFTYHYEDGRADALGRGWLGFAQQSVHDSATNVSTVTTFDNTRRQGTAYPYAGLPVTQTSTVTLDNGHVFTHLLSWSYQYTSSGNQVYSVLPRQLVEKEFETSVSTESSPQKQITTTNIYDVFGNATSIRRVTGDGYTSSTDTLYDNHPDTWLIAQPKLVVQAEITPSGEALARTTGYDYDANTGFLTADTIEPSGDSSLKLSRQLFRDPRAS